MCDHHRTEEPTVFFDWGPSGAASLAEDCATVVVIDVLSFTTSVSIACTKGSAVLPSPGGDEAAALAERAGAVLARRRRAVTPDHPWSLSPVALATAPAASLLVLPSPNGAAICASVVAGEVPPRLLTSSLRNRAGTVEALLAGMPRPIGIVAAGEQWPDGRLRPALEDLLGAALLIESLAGAGEVLSPGAELSGRAASGLDPQAVRRLVEGSRSGMELAEVGFGGDVALAAEMDVEGAVVWDGCALVAAGGGSAPPRRPEP